MVQHTCSCKKAYLAYPTAAASAPQPRLSSAPHITQPHSCTARVVQPHADSAARIHAKKTFFALPRSIEKVTRRQASIHRPRHGGTRVNTITRRAALVVACRALVQDQPRRFHWFAVMRGWVRLGDWWQKGKRSQVCSTRSGCKQGDLGRGLSARWEALDVTSPRTTACCAGAPGAGNI